MDNNKTHSAVVITGASTGIGEATALELDRRGFQVFAGIRSEEDGKRLQSKSQGGLIPLILDVTDSDQIAAATQFVREKTSENGLAGLINNAGIAISCPLETVPLADFRRQLEVNVIGHLAMIQAFIPLLRKRPGRIVNISSINGAIATPYLGPYAASKFALEALSDALRIELRHWGIRVIVIAPGAIKTPIWNKSAMNADQLSKSISMGGIKLYETDLEAWRNVALDVEQNADPVERVVEQILHALTSPRPRARYYLRFSQRFICRGFKIVPECIRDWFVCRAMGFNAKNGSQAGQALVPSHQPRNANLTKNYLGTEEMTKSE
jgi:NAD(P)-dependent dehydrogenase (short-subunit alcohol dehydrogenase family)